MKQTIILLALLAVGCVKPNPNIEKGKVYTVTHEGCEYLASYTYNGNYVFTHKGNCPNPIHYSDTCCKHK